MAVDRRADSDPPKTDRTDLEVWLRVKGPDFLRRQAANLVLGVALAIALGFFLYSRSRNKAAEQSIVAQNAAAAYDFALQLRQATSVFTGTDSAARDHQQAGPRRDQQRRRRPQQRRRDERAEGDRAARQGGRLLDARQRAGIARSRRLSP